MITLNLNHTAFGPKGNELHQISGSSGNLSLHYGDQLKASGIIDDATIAFVADDALEGTYEIYFMNASKQPQSIIQFEFKK